MTWLLVARRFYCTTSQIARQQKSAAVTCKLTNCTFIRNSADYGGGIYNYYTESLLTLGGCTFADNSASYGGGIYNSNSALAATNCILWGNAGSEIHNVDGTLVVSYSDIEGDPYTGTGNINEDPLFVDAANGDLHLGPGSPCIDAGTNDVPDPPGLPEYDFEGDARMIDGNRDGTATVDMGVDEALIRVQLPLVLKGY